MTGATKLRVIIAGSRGITDYARVRRAVEQANIPIGRIVSGMAKGVDTLAVRYAEEYGYPCDRFPADWNQWGRSAGYKRNVLMAENADALIAIWDGKSPGARHMIQIAKERGLRVLVVS